jgi:hypothetical protein
MPIVMAADDLEESEIGANLSERSRTIPNQNHVS